MISNARDFTLDCRQGMTIWITAWGRIRVATGIIVVLMCRARREMTSAGDSSGAIRYRMSTAAIGIAIITIGGMMATTIMMARTKV